MSPTKARSPKFFYGYVIVLSAFFIMLLTFGIINSYGVFLKPLVDEFGWTVAMTSGAYSAGLLARGFLGIIAGRLNDRFGPRMVVTTCCIFLGLGHILMSQISAIWQLYLYYGVMVAIGQTGPWIPLLSTVSRWFAKREGMMTGIVLAGIGIGTIILPPLAGWLISSYGWRTACIIIGIMLVVLTITLAQFLKRDPAQMGLRPYGEKEIAESPNSQRRGLSLREAIHTREFWILGVVFFAFMFGMQVVIVHIVMHAIKLGISATGAISVLTVMGGLSIAGRVAIGIIADRIGNKSALAISFILFSQALLWLVLSRELWMLHLLAVILGLGFGGIITLMAPITAELFGQSSLGVILGTINLAANVGGFISPILAGRIFDTSGNYQLAFLICIALSIISIILTLMLRPTYRIKSS